MRIDSSFFALDAEVAARELVGKLICKRESDGTVLRMKIIETECYKGTDDTACHAHRGMTERNRPLWLEGGYAYVYLCYGMYNMFNVITGREGDPQGVLIRGVEGYLGPGRFTKYAGIDRSFNLIDMKTSEVLWIEDTAGANGANGADGADGADGANGADGADGANFARPRIVCSPRIGIDYASERDRARLWRFTDESFFKK